MHPDTDAKKEAPLPLPARSIHGVLLKQAAERPDAVAIEFEARAVTYRETADRARRFAAALARRGVGPGAKIAIMLPNLPEFLVAYYGSLMAGATVVLVNVMLKPGEIDYLCSHAEASAVIAPDRLLPQVREGIKNVPSVLHLVAVGEASEGALSFEAFLAEDDAGFSPAETALEDLAHLIYTSGTTGKPKGAMITHSNVLHNLASMNLMRPPEESARTLCVLPLFHAYGLIAVMNGAIMRGATVVLQPRFDAAAAIAALKTQSITAFAGTPTMYFHILAHPDSHGASFPALRRAGCGGAALPVEIRQQFRDRFGVDLTEGYGLSETTVSVCGYPDGLPIKSGSIGVPNPQVEMKIVNDDGTEAMIGEIGEIAARGPNIMKGYYKNPEATAEALRDGWLMTGDLGYMDDKGYFFIVDRKKDMIIKGGYNIYPREIEEIIYEFPEVNMAAVVGIPDLAKGETVHAVVTLKPEKTLAVDAIVARLQERLAKYKWPSSVRIVPEIPVGPTGKILKREIRAQWPNEG